MTLRVRNTGLLPVRNEWSGKHVNFWVQGGKKTIWQHKWGYAFDTLIRDETFEPGEEKTVSVSWPQSLCLPDEPWERAGPPPSGAYRAWASWDTTPSHGDQQGAWWSNPVDFEIG